jgi:hypothetical protein
MPANWPKNPSSELILDGTVCGGLAVRDHHTRPPHHLWIGQNRGNSCPSQRAINARASLPAEILALGLSCVSLTPQLKRE